MPKLRPGTPRRSRLVAIKVTPEQFADLERAAHREQQTVSEFIRQAALKASRRVLDGY